MDGHVSISLSEEVGELVLADTCSVISLVAFLGSSFGVVERAPGEDVRRALIERDADLIVMDSAFMTDDITGFTIGVVQHVALGSHDYLGHSGRTDRMGATGAPCRLLLSGNQILYPSPARSTSSIRRAHRHCCGRSRRQEPEWRSSLGVAARRGSQNRPIAIDGVLQKSKLQLAWSVSKGPERVGRTSGGRHQGSHRRS